MKKYFNTICKCQLFSDIPAENLIEMLDCLDPKIQSYKKGTVIFSEGDKTSYICILLSGSVQLERTDFFGNRSIITHIEPSELFGEAFACAENYSLPFDILASGDSDIIYIDCARIIRICSNSCTFHNQLIYNLLKIVSTKNIILNQKSEITGKRTTREKLMAYLYYQAKKSNSNSFTIPYDRQALADYLEVDRSGLSAEISKLRKEGLLECKKSNFKIL